MQSLFGCGVVKLGKVGEALPNFESVRVDRKSIFGNPKTLEGRTRNEACDAYEVHFEQARKTNKEFAKQLSKLKAKVRAGKNLLLCCHCNSVYGKSTKRCHGQTILNYLMG